MKSPKICDCRRLLTNDSSEESSMSESEWDSSINIQSSSLTEVRLQSEVECPEVMQLAAKFEQLSCKHLDEQPEQQPQPQPIAQVEPIPVNVIQQVVVEENPGASPELVILPEHVNIIPDIPLGQVTISPAISPEQVNIIPDVLPTEVNKSLKVLPPADANISPAIPPADANVSPDIPPGQVNIIPEKVSVENLDGNKAQPPAAEGEKDGKYFLQILQAEQKRLLDLAATADHYAASLSTETNYYEHALEKLHHFSGLARLLVDSKLRQFGELCLTNVNNSSGCLYPVTNNDLHGFWDMVYQQVPPLDADFAEILKLKDNNWLALPRTVAAPSGPSDNSASTGTRRAGMRKKTGGKTQERVWRT